ncbi:uncharacterized protein V1510DRAFT_415457 [Dipodascopsis tothii]|uniref:uncharacterized protein n=1 Tax=Dipodascopsis tothii TaxID=44089 RepID=UPI0034CEF31D
MASDIFTIKGKTALVTGSSRGLGLAVARGLLEYGASTVFVTARQQKAAAAAAAELNAGGHGRAVGIACDSADPAQIFKMVEEIGRQTGGKLDIVVANAGTSWGAPLAKHPPEAFDKVMRLNVQGVFHTIQAAVPLLEAAGTAADPSRVITIGSVAGLGVQMLGAAESGTYGYMASKAGVHHLSKMLAVELGPRNITVNAVAPGFFPTKMTAGLLQVVGEDTLAESNPLGRLGTDTDLVGLVVFLVSPASAYINGAVIPLDGGRHLGSRL